jgi:glycerol uptake facilitator-like aquaporin
MTPLVRRVAAEGIGTCVLVATVVGSGIAASRLSPDNIGLQLLENSLATGAVLVALILALQPISAAFNPVVTLIERLSRSISTREAVASVTAQMVGAILGTMLANRMFNLSTISISTHHRVNSGTLLGEIVATAGLIVIIFGSVRAQRSDRVAYAVGAYITAAYWFTSSTSFANPAVTVARILSNTFAGIAPTSVTPFIAAQLVGGGVALALLALLHPGRPVLDEDLA